MKKRYKMIFALIGLLLFATVVVLAITVMNLGRLVEKGVNEYSEPMLGVAMHVDSVDVNIMKGRLGLRNFRIANPPGYSEVDVIVVDLIDVALDLTSLSGNVIVINDVQVSGIKLIAEQKGSDINFLTLQQTLQQKTNVSENTPGSSSGDSEQTYQSNNGSQRTIAIAHFRLSDSKVSVKSDFADDQQITVPGFELQDIGTPENGVSVEGAVNDVLQPLLAAVIERAKDEVLKKGVEQRLEKELQKAMGDDETVNAVKGFLKGL